MNFIRVSFQDTTASIQFHTSIILRYDSVKSIYKSNSIVMNFMNYHIFHSKLSRQHIFHSKLSGHNTTLIYQFKIFHISKFVPLEEWI
jgi:hypothetical protein